MTTDDKNVNQTKGRGFDMEQFERHHIHWAGVEAFLMVKI